MTGNRYDYIIAGGGCAGLSLLMRMLQQDQFRNKSILLIDPQHKNTNDKTWCFWEKEPDIFEPVVFHSWCKAGVHSDTGSVIFDLAPYRYKMIRSIDFYEYVHTRAAAHAGVSALQATVTDMHQLDNGTVNVQTDQGAFYADLVFNSTPLQAQPVKQTQMPRLLQHFKGWLIETETGCFDAETATLMDFRVSQEQGTTFVYVLPVSEKQALVEYTVFSETVLPGHVYDERIESYLRNNLGIQNRKILHEEAGVIPMNNDPYNNSQSSIIHIGTAGGQVKASTGYAFRFIQKKTKAIVEALVRNEPVTQLKEPGKQKAIFYDNILLRVLKQHPQLGSIVFSRIFSRNPPARILRFLDNESSLADDLQIMCSVQAGLFTRAAFQELMARM
ncbi:lycopene cyclase family protein [Sediminibacterium ginsengisoli]|uniref:Lycopene beta-cyclase n=1 Tax=Sediminibacterium ginsengisoli TaxID=413434 RepID=A0A1T4JUU2_9BACT|nr:lycopene cyclase family protein [Sediminibacterium ginsengisoli]SJZ33980.1 lycopene beta-cyclase [Sediminibacterium ginsengisoli]